MLSKIPPGYEIVYESSGNLEASRIWTDEDRQERRTLHHRGDGSFAVDGDGIDLRERMVKWRHLPR